MDRVYLFTEEGLNALRTLNFNPRAVRSFEGMSGGFIWSDEFSDAVFDVCFAKDNWAFRFLLGYRASLIAGQPRDDLRGPWDQLKIQCPQWPGFRPERCSSSLSVCLDAEGDRFIKDLEEADRQWNETRPKQ